MQPVSGNMVQELIGFLFLADSTIIKKSKNVGKSEGIRTVTNTGRSGGRRIWINTLMWKAPAIRRSITW